MSRTLFRLLAVLITLVLASTFLAPTSSAQDREVKPPKRPGMVYTESSRNFEDTWKALTIAITENPNLGIVGMVDHAAAAEKADLKLASNRVIFFGNPNVGTPLMQANQQTGIDLPQKIQVIEYADKVFVGFNDATFLAARHDLAGQPTLDIVARALRGLTAAATGPDQPVQTQRADRFATWPLLRTVPSDADFDTTWTRLLKAIEASPADIAFTLDHQANAARVELDLRPTRLVVFGNPNIGTPIMQNSPTAGIDLPLKILVWEDADGTVQVTTNRHWLVRAKHDVDVSIRPIRVAQRAFMRAATRTAVAL